MKRVIVIKSSVTRNSKFYLPHATIQDINTIINSLSCGKGTGADGIAVKSIKISSNVNGSHLSSIINKDLDLNCYSEIAKTANVRPNFKKDENTKTKNYSPTC